MAKLKFYRGLQSVYNVTTHADGVFFATDTHKIFMNGNQYGGTSDKTVANVAAKEDDPSKIVITYTDGTTQEVPVGKVAYTSNITDKTLAMPSAVGGIAKNTKISDLEGKTYDEMFDDLLFPTVDPVLSNPSASLSLNSGATLREAGSAAPQSAEFKKVFNKGAITLNGVKQNDRAGALESDVLYHGSSEANTTLPTTVPIGSTSYYYKVNYAIGPQPQNNKGGNYSTPLPAGSVTSPAFVVKGTYPFYTADSAAGYTKQPLIAWNATAGAITTGQFVLNALTPSVTKIKIPRKLVTMSKLNTLNNQWNVVSTDAWTETTEVETIDGVSVTYYIYTYNGSSSGAGTFKVTY